jgi:hypothetical protein
MEIYQRIVERYRWDALAVYWPWGNPDGVAAAKKTSGKSIAYNNGTFCSVEDFAEIVTPYLARLVARVKERGAIAFFHSDGNLMGVVDQILACEPNALQSIDPMAGMDIAVVKQRTYGRLALMGNVQCNLLRDGPQSAIGESALYCLSHGPPGGGYIFSTSNTIFPGMPLKNYEYMLGGGGSFAMEARKIRRSRSRGATPVLATDKGAWPR